MVTRERGLGSTPHLDQREVRREDRKRLAAQFREGYYLGIPGKSKHTTVTASRERSHVFIGQLSILGPVFGNQFHLFIRSSCDRFFLVFIARQIRILDNDELHSFLSFCFRKQKLEAAIDSLCIFTGRVVSLLWILSRRIPGG